jgi:hypothetical protein
MKASKDRDQKTAIGDPEIAADRLRKVLRIPQDNPQNSITPWLRFRPAKGL